MSGQLEARGGLPLVIDDGGRAAAGYKGKTGDCVTRSLAIAAQIPYRQAYEAINVASGSERAQARGGRRSSARTGVFTPTMRKVMEQHGGRWVATSGIGRTDATHLAPGELPLGRIVARVSRHCVAVIDGVMHDIGDPSRGGTRKIYGYWVFGEQA